MSCKSPRALHELMTAVDAGHAVDVYVDSASSDRRRLLGPRRRRSTYHGRGAGARKSAPAVAVAVVQASTDASFEFTSAAASYSPSSPASMVFSDGQLRAHQFPAVRSSASTGSNSSEATSPLRSSSVGSSYSSSSTSTKQQAGVRTGRKKRVSFATDGVDNKAAAAAKAGGGQGVKKSGGLLGCCGRSSRNEAVEPVARNDNRKVMAV